MPMLQCAQRATGLVFNANIHSMKRQVQNVHCQLQIHVIDILLQMCTSFKGDYDHSSTPLLMHKERCRLLKGYNTKQYPLRTSTIDESSVLGNIAVINDIYINQLKMTHDQLSDMVIPSINDQSTNEEQRCSERQTSIHSSDSNAYGSVLDFSTSA